MCNSSMQDIAVNQIAEIWALWPTLPGTLVAKAAKALALHDAWHRDIFFLTEKAWVQIPHMPPL